MTRTIAIILATLAVPALVPTSAAAQAIGEPLPGRGPVKTKPAPARPAPAQAARPCPEYGPGFVRLEGASACVRIGGGVRVEVGKSSADRRFGSGAAAMAYGEARGAGPLGEVRAVVSGRVQRDSLAPAWQRW